jgi:protocatechuate 3,4-dioxygenase beta subunit
MREHSPRDLQRDHQGTDSTCEPGAAPLARRSFLRWCLAGPAAVALAASGAEGLGDAARWVRGGLAQAQTMPLTPACGDGEDTVSNTEGPYYKLYTPERRNFREGVEGAVLLTLAGNVYSADCRPVPDVLLDFWHADANGEYDLSGYRLRGHQYSLADGSYLLETIVPKWYVDGSLWRTSHVHVKVQPPNGPILTTQLFFPDSLQAYGQDTASLNAQDFLVPPEGIDKVTIRLGPLVANQYAGTFDFVIATSYPSIPGS